MTGAGVVSGECPLEPCSSRCCAILQSAAVLHSVLHCCVHLSHLVTFHSSLPHPGWEVRGEASKMLRQWRWWRQKMDVDTHQMMSWALNECMNVTTRNSIYTLWTKIWQFYTSLVRVANILVTRVSITCSLKPAAVIDTMSDRAWKGRSTQRFVITKKAPTRAFSWLKAASTAFTFKTLLRHYYEPSCGPSFQALMSGPAPLTRQMISSPLPSHHDPSPYLLQSGDWGR